jgi:hypothetical protein
MNAEGSMHMSSSDRDAKRTNRALDRKALLSIAVVIVTLVGPAVDACTIFSFQNDGSVWVGNNEDAGDPDGKMWVIPPDEGRYGRICFGFDDDYRIVEGGMNDQGLFIDVNALNESTGWQPDPGKPDWEEWEGWFETGVPDGILALCANVDEAQRIFRSYNLLTFDRVKYLLADKTGASIIIEWGRDGLMILPAQDTHQVSTNFVTSSFAPGDEPCPRFQLAGRLLAERANLPPLDLARLVLSATAMEFNTPTQYSNIYDLSTGTVWVFLYHNFEEVITIDLRTELAQGPQRRLLRDLFGVQPYSYGLYRKFKG